MTVSRTRIIGSEAERVEDLRLAARANNDPSLLPGLVSLAPAAKSAFLEVLKAVAVFGGLFVLVAGMAVALGAV